MHNFYIRKYFSKENLKIFKIIVHQNIFKVGKTFMNLSINNTKKFALGCLVAAALTANAGNPDRQGEAGAYELLLNPWARSAGLHMMNTATVNGVEALNQNIAGLARLGKINTEIGFTQSTYLQGTGMSMVAGGLAQRIGENGYLGVGLNAFNFGKIPVTTANLPEGTGATMTPTFFNVAVSYSHNFMNKVYVGVTFRFINQTLADVSASGAAIDAGVQYVNGSEEYPERFKLGIALRNVGTRMTFGGQALSSATTFENNDGTVLYTTALRGAGFELPSQLNIGAAYDLLPQANTKLTLVGNFAANSFSRDELGAGLEFSMDNKFAVRGAYRGEMGTGTNSIYNGVSAGASVEIPLDKLEKTRKLGIDYSYMMTSTWGGTHNISLRLNL